MFGLKNFIKGGDKNNIISASLSPEDKASQIAAEQERKNAMFAAEDAKVLARRSFLTKAVALSATAVLGSSLSGNAEAAPKVANLDASSREAIANNQIGVNKLKNWLNTHSEDRHEMFNSLGSAEHDVYNDLETLMDDYDNGKFTQNPSKYYKPKNPEKSPNLILKRKLEKEGVVFRDFNLNADHMIVGEIQGANKDISTGKLNKQDLKTKGFAILEKGTKILIRNNNGITENYIEACFNRIYTSAILCPVCKGCLK